MAVVTMQPVDRPSLPSHDMVVLVNISVSLKKKALILIWRKDPYPQVHILMLVV
jgi:hypothetical protein